MFIENLSNIAEILFAPATLLLIGKYIISRQDDFEKRISALEQVFNGYNSHDKGILERLEEVEILAESLDRRKH